jgi:transposase
MSMGKRKRDRQPTMWVATTHLPTAASHPFYRRLNELLAEHGFDDFVEAECAGFYAETMGRPGLPPGIYFRLLLIGYFEGIDAERGIAWRAKDSLALRDCLGIGLGDEPPDHSTISRTRRLIALETHRAVFTWVLQCLGNAGLVKGKTIGIDATTLEANAALKSIVRRDTGEGYEEFLARLAKASGIGTPTRADLARLDRRRKKKGSNNEWTHPHDPDAKITKMKDGRTHLAHKAEHAIDLETGAIVGVTVQGADQGDTTTIQQTLPEAAEQLEAVAAVTEAFNIGGLQRPVVFPPTVDRLAADAVLLGHLRDRFLVGLPQDRHHLLFGESGLFHGSLVSWRAPFSQASGGPKIARQVRTGGPDERT